jgi:hypothetical protein
MKGLSGFPYVNSFQVLVTAITLSICGCEFEPAAVEKSSESPGASAASPSGATISGQVTWQGKIPEVPSLLGSIPALIENGPRQRQVHGNPNAPHVDSISRAVTSAVVFLRNVEPSLVKPWDLPSVRVLQRGLEFHIRQGSVDSHYGFVRQGDKIEMVSCDRAFYAIHANGVEFFSLTFPDPDAPLNRRLTNKGIVELTSAAGHFWMRAYLFVDDAPYYCRTDSKGRFTLTNVPSGEYDLICWMPSWLEDHHERDPETAIIIRRFFRPAVEKLCRVKVMPGQLQSASFVWCTSDFLP